MKTAWIMIVALAAILVILVIAEIHTERKRYRQEIERREQIIREQQLKEIERLQRQVRKEMADEGYFIVKNRKG